MALPDNAKFLNCQELTRTCRHLGPGEHAVLQADNPTSLQAVFSQLRKENPDLRFSQEKALLLAQTSRQMVDLYIVTRLAREEEGRDE